MQAVHVQHTTNKNGSFCTIITNLPKIVHDIGITEMPYVIRFLCHFLQSSTIQAPNTTLVGHYTQAQVQAAIYQFIQQYIMCSKCTIPERKFKLDKHKMHSICHACGNELELDESLVAKIL